MKILPTYSLRKASPVLFFFCLPVLVFSQLQTKPATTVKQSQPAPKTPSTIVPQTGKTTQAAQPATSQLAAKHPAASAKGGIVLQWGKPVTEVISEKGDQIQYLNCKGARCLAANHFIPQYFQHIKLWNGINHLEITLVNPVYETLTPAEISALGSNSKYLSSAIIPQYAIGTGRGEHSADISFTPVIKNTSGVMEKLVSFSLNIQQSEVHEMVKARSKHGSFASTSVLGTGAWFRIGVTKDEVYKLSYSFFKRAGMDMKTLVPANIRIYGNGPGMLPENNSLPRFDDLVENAIYVNGQTDSTFKQNDYVLFYGQSPAVWTYSTSDKHYHHKVNLYTDTTYYFVNIDLGPGKRINSENSLSSTPTDTVTSFDDYAYHEVDGTNLIQSGSTWFGEQFDITNSYTFSFNFPNIAYNPVYVQSAIASRYDVGYGPYSFYSVGSAVDSVPTVQTTEYYAPIAALGTCHYTFNPSGSLVYVTASKITSGAVGWLYYIEVNARRQLSLSGNQMEFRDMNSTGTGKTTLYSLNSVSPVQVWDVTDPRNVKNVNLTNNSNNYKFELASDTLKQYVAFNGATFDSASFSGSVPVQNLHSLGQADLTIVTNPLFWSEANQLANFHRTHDNLAVNVVTTQQVYNEFSSGRQDPVAIRDFMRMFYYRTTNYTNSPKYLLLFGDASFDPKNRLAGNTDFVVTYESAESFDPTASYVTDDFYTLLDSSVAGQPNSGSYTLELGVGRLPADNIPQAQSLVNKVMTYETPTGQPLNYTTNCCNGQAQYNLGNWKNIVCFVAHDGNEDLFQTQMEEVSSFVNASYPNLNINKIYLDAYPMIQTPGGPRYPSVNTAIDNQIDQGLLIFNYDGHGGPLGLAFSRVMDFTDIASWNNINTLSLFFNASCEFGRFDNPLQISGGELCIESATGGNIAIMSAARDVYASGNQALNDSFFHVLYNPLPDGTLPRFGDLLREAKNLTGKSYTNNLMFALLGDPAVRLAYPQNRVYTSAINSVPVTPSSPADTLKALSKVTVTGYVGDTAGNLLSNYSGLLYPTIFDKFDTLSTLANLGASQSPVMKFALQNHTLYKGLISVNNGKFSFTFILPKDILYYYGFGKISYYSENQQVDATGNYRNIVIGGTASNIHNNGKGPSVRLYVNDSNFVYGGLTNQNPQLFAVLFDSNGVNTAGNSIGHDITAVLDNNTENTYDLTNYYQPALNSYQRGTVTFPFSGLSNGTHSLSLRVWNVYDNTSLSSTEFNVEPQSQLQLQHVLNYPNPFTTHTEFFFEINQVCDLMDVQIQIFSVSGKLVRNILTSVHTDSFRSEPIDWDGKDDFGDRMGKGVYIYHLKVRTSQGITADTYQKLVIL